MANIVIYTKNKTTPLAGILEDIDEVSVRVENGAIMREHSMLNPSLIIVENVDKLADILMTTKFICPLLFIGERFDTTVRAEGYDFISSPVDKEELLTRAKALLKISYYKNKVAEVSTTDELTGLHNRKYLQEALDAEMSRSRRYKTKVSCILFDLDYFKAVNDIYGYEWGDILLRNIAGKLEVSVRKEDVVTRYGDEEFLLILPNTTEDHAFVYAERFRREVEKMEFIPAGEEERHPITISGGIATFPCMENVHEDANTLIRYAEHALYNAKHRGRNKIVQFSQINLEYN
ncbi:MAG: GGDEF domain-containing protein [Candidatus Gastranaerophilales bacterium]|nr:GGDEF domain-containing protein [Candidatus Gastranaerophilales bacterium]